MDVSGDMLFESILYLHDTYIATFAAFAALRYLHRRFGCQDPSIAAFPGVQRGQLRSDGSSDRSA